MSPAVDRRSRSRADNALVASGFAYAKFGLGIVLGVVLVPLILSRIEARSYGLWLATGELVAYLATLDLGVLAVLPWMIAESDGRGERAAIRRHLVNGVVVAVTVPFVYVAIAAFAWWTLPGVVGLSATDHTMLTGPLVVLVVATAISYPFNVFTAALNGLQDFSFTGGVSVVHMALRAVLTGGLLLSGAGIYALALGIAVPLVVTAPAALIRARRLAPDLFIAWPGPSVHGVRRLLREGLGGWLAQFGWKLTSASHAVVIALLGFPALVPVFACTSKLGGLLMQLSWTLPDNGLIGLAQLHGQGRADRVRQLTGAVLRLLLVLAGGVACVLLAVNPTFVRLWVGPEFYGGFTLNAILALSVIVTSLVHGLSIIESVVGYRLSVGLSVVCAGVAQVGLALLLGRVWVLDGVGLAGVVIAFTVALPVGTWILRPSLGLDFRWLATQVIVPWLRRTAPLIAVALLLGAWPADRYQWVPFVVLVPVVAAYVWRSRAVCLDLPVPSAIRRWLVVLGLAPGDFEPRSSEARS